jgi:release factor glutamine methyltransferase
LEDRFGLTMSDILCGKVTELSADNQAELGKIIGRLEKGEPVQYVLGYTSFCWRSFHVAPGVLIPRPETEELCRWITADGAGAQVLDIGTGSGCIAVTLALDLPASAVTAWDISLKALNIARENANALGAAVTFEVQDALLPPDDDRQWNLIVSNPPYVMHSEIGGMTKNVLNHEPDIALFAPHGRPILFYEVIGNYARHHLVPGGALYFELNPLTADEVGNSLRKQGFAQIEFRDDQFGKCRFLKAVML